MVEGAWNPLYTRFQIPDLSKPPVATSGLFGPTHDLIDFAPGRLDPARVVGRKIEQLETSVGTYGMGGPGFFGLRLGDDWLVVTLWGAGEWISCCGRLVEDVFYVESGRPAPWIDQRVDWEGIEFRRAVIGRTITSIVVAKLSMRIELDNGFDFSIDEDPAARPATFSGVARSLAASEDLRDGVLLFPTAEIWV